MDEPEGFFQDSGKDSVMFYCVDNRWDDPARNLAAEEFLLHNSREDFVMFYVNASSVIVGKHQNVFREVNLAFAGKRNIPVVRRLSGGGTVYHDTGNLNFSFILSGEQGKLVDFARYIRPVVDFLQSLGVPAVTDDRNNILIAGRKVSGNAEHIFKDRVLHHGTLLFDADLQEMEEALRPHDGGVSDRAISSRRSGVTNILDHLKEKMTMDDFRERLKTWCMDYFSPCSIFHFTGAAAGEIERLAKEKYASWEWNIAYSPSCVLHRTLATAQGEKGVDVSLAKGRVENVTGAGREEELKILSERLRGVPFRHGEVARVLASLTEEGKLSVISSRNWLNAFFGY